ncbi:CaiB/BaiF CoA transferase family protein [Streptantibioticus cattleyicolor]|uniref:CAIB/BAIF family protein n=1 Tax=Streptantibioticus cattleyicolor (strain ATCC 35852 / DSM 46488 / JCM 4925 / NBRC 14057 / NRRL 8057) TaxID=1003195 RepID=G8XFU4_STREN|nr:CoA transferase [Streptantibioticus cattleyicolor]AEW98583.1 CAIB/BAIF family protein [Streptantibioticus cattleyicolor NRRL 8057 = DSM 46488]
MSDSVYDNSVRGPLSGIRVLDAATLVAAPLAGCLLADYGAEVLKVEHPRGDPIRTFGARKDDVSLWWKLLGRNKDCVSLDLSTPEGQEIFRRLAGEADVVIENFRPGTFEKWGLDYDTLSAENPGLVMARVTGYGQSGPYARRPGFGTAVEALSGVAAMTGDPHGPPVLPSFPMGDGVTGVMTAFAVLTALRARDRDGHGQVVDVSLWESLLSVVGAYPTVHAALGTVPERRGNRSAGNAPRNTYRTKDGGWVAVSAPSRRIAERVMRLVGRPDLAEQPWFGTGTGRKEHVEEIDEAVAAWVGARDRDDVVRAFEEAEAVVAPVYDFADVAADPHLAHREALIDLPDPELGSVRLQNVPFRLSRTPGAVRHAGGRLGGDNARVYGALGVDEDRVAELHREGVV